jgi:hypothetical protein
LASEDGAHLACGRQALAVYLVVQTLLGGMLAAIVAPGDALVLAWFWFGLPLVRGAGRTQSSGGLGADGMPDGLDLDELADVIRGLAALVQPVDRVTAR